MYGILEQGLHFIMHYMNDSMKGWWSKNSNIDKRGGELEKVKV